MREPLSPTSSLGSGSLAPNEGTLGRRQGLRLLCLILAGTGAICAMLFTWSGSGDVSLPDRSQNALTEWVNGHGRLRNTPAYFFLAGPVFVGLGYRLRRYGLYLLLAFSAGLEFCQLAIKTRTFDVWDILLSWVGIVLAYLVYGTLHALYRRKRT